MNPFSALESDDEEEFTKVQSHKKSENKKKTQTAKAANNSSPSAPVNPGAATEKKVSNRGGGGRGDNRHRRGAGRGGKETGDRVKHNKREYDRRSGTGRGTEVAKGGAGKGGWGTNADEIAQQRRELEEEKNNGKPAEGTEVVAEEEPVEPEPPTYTLDEFIAKREASRQGSAIFSAVEERRVTDDYSGFKTKNDDLNSFIELGGSQKNKSNSKSQRSAVQNKVTDLGFHAAPKEDRRDDRGGRGRGDRGNRGDRNGRDRGGRGERGERRPRGGKVDINDQSAFPSL